MGGRVRAWVKVAMPDAISVILSFRSLAFSIGLNVQGTSKAAHYVF